MSRSKLFFDVATSLDGFIAPEGMDLAHANDPEFKQWMSQWMKLQNWVFKQQFFRKNLKLGDGGESGRDIRIAGGANVIQQYLNAGLVDEFTIHYSPVFFGHGAQLFSGTSKDIGLKIKEAVASKEVTHVTFDVVR